MEHAQAALTPLQPHSEQTCPPPTRKSYAETLVDPPPHANPRLAAKEGIRAQQIMLEGIDRDSKISQMNGPQMKLEINRILEEVGLEGKGIRSAIAQRNGGILIKMENDNALEWIKRQENRVSFCIEIGPDVVFKPRSHTVIAFNVPITIDPKNETHRNEILESNHIEADAVAVIRWVKPTRRRTPEQKSTHLFISFTNAKAANRIIADGLNVCNRKARTEKVKKEPIRCLKCQEWNHQTYECTAPSDKCGNCAEDHRTDQCPHPHATRCVSCKSTDHASWNRRCPIYCKKIEECDARNPENLLQFFPTTEPWTWTAHVDTKLERENKPRVHDIYKPSYANHTPYRNPRNDTYRPGPSDFQRPSQQLDMHRSSQGPPESGT